MRELSGGGAGESELALLIRRLADVRPRRLEWLWPGRIPLGKFSLLCGDPGLGKSLVALDIAARVTSGSRWPDTRTEIQQGTVLLCTAEDDAADTVAPRLAALGADLDRVQIVEGLATADGDCSASFSLGEHLEQLDDALAALPDARLVVLDPITAYLKGVNESRGSAVRRMLGALTDIAARRGVAVLAVTHLAKRGSGPASLRALDSLAFAATARSVWLIAQNPADPKGRLMVPAKTNLAGNVQGLAYRIESNVEQPHVVWDAAPLTIAADDLVRLSRGALRELPERVELTPRARVADWLREQLIDGPWLRKELCSEASALGFAQRTVYRALQEIGAIGVEGSRLDKYWILIDQAAQLPEDEFSRGLALDGLVEMRAVRAAKRRCGGAAAT